MDRRSRNVERVAVEFGKSSGDPLNVQGDVDLANVPPLNAALVRVGVAKWLVSRNWQA